MSRSLIELVSLGPLPEGFKDELGHMPSLFRVTVLDDPAPADDPIQARRVLERCAEELIAETVLVLCHYGSGYHGVLDEAVAILSSQRRDQHLIVPMPFGFESRHVAFHPGMLERSLFHAQTLIVLDGRSLAARSTADVTLNDLFRIQAAKLAYLIQDLVLVASAPRDSHVRHAFTGTFRWESTWPSSMCATEHLSILLRIYEEPSLAILASHGLANPERMFRILHRMDVSTPILCRGSGTDRRLGAFASTSIGALT